MSQTIVVLTQTSLDSLQVNKFMAYSLINSSTSEVSVLGSLSAQIPDQELLNENYRSLIYQNRLLAPELEGVEDFRSVMPGLYQNYNRPTLLFLGDLSRLSEETQQGMLKLMEEPPSNLYIIVYAQGLENILPTIVSRSRIFSLPQQIVFNLLDKNTCDKVKKFFPLPVDAAKAILQDKVENLISNIDYKTTERQEIDLWLWQIQTYLSKFYELNSDLSVARAMDKVLTARHYNRRNVQKRFVLGCLY